MARLDRQQVLRRIELAVAQYFSRVLEGNRFRSCFRFSTCTGDSAAFPSNGRCPIGTPPSCVTFRPNWICLTFLRPLFVRP